MQSFSPFRERTAGNLHADPGNVAFVATRAHGPSQKFALMTQLMVYQRLHYFPEPQTIPGAIISHIRAVMKLPSDLVPDRASATLYRYHAALRAYFGITVYQGQQVRHIAAEAMLMHQQAISIFIRFAGEP